LPETCRVYFNVSKNFQLLKYTGKKEAFQKAIGSRKMLVLLLA
jgi:hypothetical protein